MTNLLFFGHDAYDAAVRRRIQAFADAGAAVTGFTMRRGPAAETPWPNVDLGPTRDAAYAHRVAALAQALPKVLSHRAALRAADLIYARNLDMLALAVAARAASGAKARIVYECLDVHRLMTRPGAIGAGMRAAERMLLQQSALLVVSSPAFLRAYFEPHHAGRYRPLLIENRLPPGHNYGPRPAPAPKPASAPLTIGWFGNLRCKRSLALLLALADRFPDRVRLTFRGYPALTEIPDFDAQVSGRANLCYGGRYAWPGDLAAIYKDVDLVWAGDFHDPDANSRWLLPNRIYEGGYYAAVPIAPVEAETGRWIAERGFGFPLAEPLEQTLPALIESLTPEALAERRARLLAAPTETFVQPVEEMKLLLEAAAS